MQPSALKIFLTEKMSMTEVYQPVIIKELLKHGGTRTKDQLAAALADYDLSVKDYYRKVVIAKLAKLSTPTCLKGTQYGIDH